MNEAELHQAAVDGTDAARAIITAFMAGDAELMAAIVDDSNYIAVMGALAGYVAGMIGQVARYQGVTDQELWAHLAPRLVVPDRGLDD